MTTIQRLDDIWLIDLGTDHAFNSASVEALDEAIGEIESADRPLPVVITASGKKFSVGLDLAHLGELGDGFVGFVNRVESVLDRLIGLEVPSIAAINGHAFGAGALLSLACDLRVMNADRGYFRLPEVELGVDFTDPFGRLIASKVPGHAVTRCAVLGERFDAQTALSLGIVDQTAPASEVLDAATTRALGMRGLVGPTVAQIRRRFVGYLVGAVS